MKGQNNFIQEHRFFELIRRRVCEKTKNYQQYEFNKQYNDFLKTFFDLAQEFDALDDFYRICVAVPLEMIGLQTALYLFNDKKNCLELVCDAVKGVLAKPIKADKTIFLSAEPYEGEDAYIVPIYSKAFFEDLKEDPVCLHPEVEKLPNNYRDTNGRHHPGRILGMFIVQPLTLLSQADKFFFVKYSNRIGYNLHNRLIALQNIDHIKFINNLVMDIEHNIIVPNMYFKHLFNRLKKNISRLEEIKAEFREKLQAKKQQLDKDNCDCLELINDVHAELSIQHHQLVKHHANISLFLESLFRREHFERGRLVLRLKSCFIEREVILPQLEYYWSRLHAAKIVIERPKNILKEEFQIRVDVGLLSQVYANLFSNAAKYTSEIIDHNGKKRKAMAYGRELVANFAESQQGGIKFNVFTTGPHLTMEEGNSFLLEGIRGKQSGGIPGTGHGLAFIRYVIEMHGGLVGYEPTPYGNNFYFILPFSSDEVSPDLLDNNS